MIDCDAHAVIDEVDVLVPFLDDHWREVLATTQFAGPTDQAHPPNLETSLRGDLPAVDGRDAGRSVQAMRAHLLDPLQVDVAVLSCDYGVESVHNPDAAAALARAVNDWQAEQWLAADPRLRAAIVVPSRQPSMAVAEIARMGSHPGFVSVYLPVRSALPYGNREWWPVLEAALEHELVVEIHFGGSPGLAPTASGWPTTWLEEYVDMASAFQSQLTSLVAEGAFERFPELRVALIEAGFAWLPAFMWRFDKGWRGLRREIPWTRRAPSEYIHEHVRVALQPVDGPPESARMAEVIEQLGGCDMLMFSSDYPHRHALEGLEAIPGAISAEDRESVLDGNARSFYRL